jgi:NADPH:quinone reductase-like Zn-dependent oxidoreductase
MMKPIIQQQYGAPRAVLQLQDIATPVVKDDEVLVRVRAASIHVGDWLLVNGVPYVLRMVTGLRTPKHRVPGTDIAGTVEAVGTEVTQLRPAMRYSAGARARLPSMRVPERTTSCRSRPTARLSKPQPSGCPQPPPPVSSRAREDQPGQQVLINGASGGVGTFAVQIAKAFGAAVTGVCSTRNVDLVRSIGADHVIDYAHEDFTRGGQRYDFILDTVGNHALSPTRRALSPTGRLSSNGRSHADGRWVGALGSVIKVATVSLFVRQQLASSVKVPNRADLVVLKGLLEAGKVTPVIDGVYPLSRTPEAIAHVGEGHARGTVVITI